MEYYAIGIIIGILIVCLYEYKIWRHGRNYRKRLEKNKK